MSVKEKLNIEHVHTAILSTVEKEEGIWDIDEVDSDLAKQLNTTVDELVERIETEGVDSTELFCSLMGLRLISSSNELGDLDKAYWHKQIVFQRLSDGKYFAANFDESDRGYWGGFGEVKELEEVDRIERNVITVTYE